MNNKKNLVLFPFVIFVIAVLMIVTSKIYFERLRYIDPISTNIYKLNFIDHWKQVTDMLNMDEQARETARVQNFNATYDISGEMKNMTYQITWKKENQFYYAAISYNEFRKNIHVVATKVSEWIQYDSMLSAYSLFHTLDKINIKNITSKNDYSYYGLSVGVWDNLTFPDGKIFAMNESSIVSLNDDEAVNGYWIRTYCMEQYDANSYNSVKNEYYMINPQ